MLPSNLPILSTAAWLSKAQRCRVATIARLLNQLPTESSAVITSADTLLTELFSHRGEAVKCSEDSRYNVKSNCVYIAIQTTLQSPLNMLDQLFFKSSAMLKCQKQEHIQHLECHYTAEGIFFSFFGAMSTNLMWFCLA